MNKSVDRCLFAPSRLRGEDSRSSQKEVPPRYVFPTPLPLKGELDSGQTKNYDNVNT